MTQTCTVSLFLQISVFFSRAKTALVMGTLLLFGSVFPYVGVGDPSYSMTAKVRSLNH